VDTEFVRSVVSYVFLVSLGKSSVSELHFVLNITTVIDNIIIKKGINCLLSDGKSTAKRMYCITFIRGA